MSKQLTLSCLQKVFLQYTNGFMVRTSKESIPAFVALDRRTIPGAGVRGYVDPYPVRIETAHDFITVEAATKYAAAYSSTHALEVAVVEIVYTKKY